MVAYGASPRSQLQRYGNPISGSQDRKTTATPFPHPRFSHPGMLVEVLTYDHLATNERRTGEKGHRVSSCEIVHQASYGELDQPLLSTQITINALEGALCTMNSTGSPCTAVS